MDILKNTPIATGRFFYFYLSDWRFMPRKPQLAVVKKYYETLKRTDDWDLLKSQGCVFQYLVRDQDIYYYLHGWYGTYGRAFIAYIKFSIISDEHINFINTMIYDYGEGAIQNPITLEDLTEALESEEGLKQFEGVLYGKNCLMTYRLYKDRKTPSIITNIEILENHKNIIFLKKDIRIPKPLLPGGIEKSQPKKTMRDILEEIHAKKLLKEQLGES